MLASIRVQDAMGNLPSYKKGERVRVGSDGGVVRDVTEDQNGYHYKVQLDDGESGWYRERALSPGRGRDAMSATEGSKEDARKAGYKAYLDGARTRTQFQAISTSHYWPAEAWAFTRGWEQAQTAHREGKLKSIRDSARQRRSPLRDSVLTPIERKRLEDLRVKESRARLSRAEQDELIDLINKARSGRGDSTIDRARRALDRSVRDAGLFSKAQLEQLQSEWQRIERIDPASPHYRKMINMLDSLPQEQLKQLAGARVPFVSRLAANRVTRDADLLHGYSEGQCREMIRHYAKEVNNTEKPANWRALARSSLATWQYRLDHLTGSAMDAGMSRLEELSALLGGGKYA